MIISKSNLQCLHITKHDKIPVLSNVVVAEDGSTVGSNGKALMLVSPVSDKVKKSFPIKSHSSPEEIIFSEETAKEVVKNIPRDTKFGGVLEHCDVRVDDENESQVNFSTTDGKRTKYLTGKRWERQYIDYRTSLREALSSRKDAKVVVNLRRFISLLDAIDKACPDGSGTSAAYIEFSNENDIIVRAINHSNGQRALGVMKSYKGNEGTWLEPGEWERSFYSDEVHSDGSNEGNGDRRIPLHSRNLSGSSDSRKLQKIPKKKRKVPRLKC